MQLTQCRQGDPESLERLREGCQAGLLKTLLSRLLELKLLSHAVGWTSALGRQLSDLTKRLRAAREVKDVIGFIQ